MLATARLIFLAAVFLPFAFVVSLLLIVRPFHQNNGYLIMKPMGPIAVWILGIKHFTENFERLNVPGGKVIIGNHQHGIDLFVFGSFMPRGTLGVGKKSLAFVPIFGFVYWICGHVFVDRKNQTSAHATMNRIRAKLASGNASLFMMPEGTRTNDKGFAPFKKGAFRLAIETQLPIQPVVANSFYKTIDLNKWHAGSIIIQALDPIPTAGKTLDDLEAIMAKAHAAMKAAIDGLDRRLLA